MSVYRSKMTAINCIALTNLQAADIGIIFIQTAIKLHLN